MMIEFLALSERLEDTGVRVDKGQTSALADNYTLPEYASRYIW